MSIKVQVLKARKILVGSVGVATVSFLGTACSSSSVANLMAPPSCEIAPQNPDCIGPRPDAGTDGGAHTAADAGPDTAADIVVDTGTDTNQDATDAGLDAGDATVD